MNCRYCDKPVESGVKTLAYWGQSEFLCHPECKQSGEKQEAIDCQTVDADCNDCRYFLRASAGVARWTGGRMTLCTDQVNGWCSRFEKITMAYPHQWTGRECFVHRRVEPTFSVK